MHTLIRHLVMWLLALALPLQGAAAATRLHCEPAQQTAGVSHGARSAHDHAAHVHHEDLAASHHADAASGASSSDHAAAAPHTQLSCSACAACCPAAAIPAAPLVVAAAEKVETVLPVISDVAVMFLTGGPDRPPRHSLA